MNAPNKDEVLINDLEEFLTFCRKKLSGYDLKFSRHKTRKALLYSYIAALQGVLSPMPALLRDRKTLAAHILVRPLFEAHLTLYYLYASPNHSHVVQAAYDDQKRRLRTTQDWKNFLTRNPYYQKHMDLNQIDQAILRFAKNKARIEALYRQRYSNNNYEWPSLEKRARGIDSYINSKRPGKPERHPFYWSYITVYDYWSRMVHMDAAGINSLFREVEDGWEVQVDGDPADVEKICISVYTMFYDLVHLFSQQFGTPTSAELKAFRNKMKSYQKPTP